MQERNSAAASRRRRSVLVFLALALMLYVGASLVTLHLQNPFEIVRKEACRVADSSCDDARFLRGSYGYRLLYSVAEGDVIVGGPVGSKTVHVELLNSPFTGWSVRSFSLSG